MKNATKVKKQRSHNPVPPKSVTVPAGWLQLPRWAVLGLCLLTAAAATWVFLEFVVWNKLPSNVVGKWVVVEGPQEGATFDFFRNGTLLGKINMGGKEGIVNARVRVDEKKILSTTTHPQTGQDDTRVQIIRTLTAKNMVLEDEQGNMLKLERAE